ncbi:PAS domain S-box protein [bacterium]|nr:PAS domain S-box protein [bacterium]
MKLTLAQQGFLLLAVPLLLLLALVGRVFRLDREAAAAQQLAVHSKEVVGEARRVQAGLVDVQSAVRGYVITGDPELLAPFEAARGRWRDDADRLTALVADNPEQSARAAAIAAKGAAVLDWQADLIALARAGDVPAAVERVRTREGNRQTDEFRATVADFLDDEYELDRARADAVRDARDRLSTLLAAAAGVGVLTTAALALAFHHRVSRRFAVLVLNTHRLSAGAELAPALAGGDEIARLDHAFRDMAAQLTAASDRLRDTAREVRDLYDNAPCGYHSVDPAGTVIAMNATELQWLGRGADEVIGRARFSDFVAPASRAAYAATFARVREDGGATDVEIEVTRHDGTTFPVLLNSSAVRGPDGKYLRSRTTLTDLTERRRAEDEVLRLNADLEGRVRERTAELAETNARLVAEGAVREQAEAAAHEAAARLRGLIDTAVDAIITIDEHGTVESANPAAERMFGYHAADLVGGNVRRLMPEPYHSEHDGYLANYLATGVRRIIGHGREVAGRRQDGTTFPIHLAVSEFRAGGRRVFTGFVRDITDRKRVEHDLRRAVDELEDTNRELAQKNAENEMFVYSVSHDLRSPLVNLQGFSRELEKGCKQLTTLLADEAVPAAARDPAAALLNGKMAKAMGFIQTAVLRLSGIIEALLRLSRAGRVEYRWEAVDARRVADRVVGSMQTTITDRGATVTLGDLSPAWGDPTAVEQVFANLIGNALAYLDPARPGRVEVGCLPAEAGAQRTYFVRDNGLGIAEAHRAKIFQVFQRAHPGVGAGEGIGLAIVARIAERHRGRVWVESEAGAGSTFYVTLPAPPAG